MTNLFTNKDGSIAALESIRLNPNLVSANKLRNDLNNNVSMSLFKYDDLIEHSEKFGNGDIDIL